MKHKAFSAKREEVIKDINRVAWARNKKLIIDGYSKPEDNNQATVEYENVLKRVNYEAYKVVHKHVVEGANGITNETITISYTDAILHADRISWKLAGVRINPSYKNGTNTGIKVVYDDIKKAADMISWKVANCRIPDGNVEARFEAQMDDETVDVKVFNNGYSSAISNIYRELSFCLSDTEAIADSDHTFSVQFDERWNGDKDVLAALISQYIQTYTLYEWFKVVMPTEASTYLAESDKTMLLIVAEAKSDYTNDSWLRNTWKLKIAELNDMLRLNILSEVSPAIGDTATFNLSFVTAWLGSKEALAGYMQRYVTDGILKDWFALVLPNNNAFVSESEQCKQLIENELRSDENGTEWFAETFKSAIDTVSGMLRMHVKNSIVDSITGGYTFLFSFPNGWGGSTVSLGQYISDFAVDYILYRWFTLESPDKVELYEARMTSWKERIVNEALNEVENFDWFERQLATAVDHLKGQLRWCIHEHTGTIIDNTIKTKALVYGEEEYPAVEQDPTSFDDDVAFLDAPKEKHIPIPEHTFRFRFSDTWRGNFETLGNYIHRYIVDYILYEWFRMTLPSEASVYLASAEQWEDKVINEARSEDVRNVYFRL